MKGLVKNNLYAAGFSAKWLFIILIIAQIFVIILGKSFPLIVYSIFCVVGFAVNTIACYRKENASKWNTYKLTMPVTRKQIVKSKFIAHIIWTIIGVAIVGICIALTLLFNGFIFEVATDIFLVFAIGISISLLLGAFFYPMHYLGGDEHNELNLGISIVGAASVFAVLVYFVNLIFGFDKMAIWQIVSSMVVVLLISAIAYITAFLLSVLIYSKKEC